MGLGVFSNGDLRPAREQRRAAARAALDEMKGNYGSVAWIDDSSLDFLTEEISEQMMQELARTWPAPTSSKLAALAETIYLQEAVAALDGKQLSCLLALRPMDDRAARSLKQWLDDKIGIFKAASE